MMTNQFVNINKMDPITPPPELMEAWSREVNYNEPTFAQVATKAARWGADQELEACEKYWMTHGISPEGVVRMREHRRPKPPSLKEQALSELNLTADPNGAELSRTQVDLIRKALEALPND